MFKVLIIDDEEIIREGMRVTIDWSSLGCEISGEAEDGTIGAELVKKLKPDIVVTDIRMPGLSGLEMISLIRKLKFTCKVIIITGFRDFDYAQEAIKQGAFRYILKPIKTEEINVAITDAIKEIKEQNATNAIYNNLEKKVKEYYGLNSVDNTSASNPVSDEKSGTSYLINKAVDFMKKNYKSDINLKTVSDEIFISTWYLSKLLKKETGSNFIDIMNEIRIDEAKKLLSEPKYKIYEIAEEVGYVDVAYFTKTFKKVTGFTPMEYKNKK